MSQQLPQIVTILLLSFTLLACRAAETSSQEVAAQLPAEPAVAAEATEAPTTPAVEIEPITEPTATAIAIAPTEEPAGQAEVQIRLFRIVPEASRASYTVEEEFFDRPIDLFTAIGRTNEIEGQFQLEVAGDQVALKENKFSVDLRTLTSDDHRRDNRIRQQWLESNRFPLAEFRATAIEDFPVAASEGQDISFKVAGNMTIRDVTRPVTFDTTAKLEGNTFTGIAITHLFMRDFGFEPPSILGMLKVTDGVMVTVEFTAEEVDVVP